MRCTHDELKALVGREFLEAVWEDDGVRVLSAIDSTITTPMTMKDFLDHCTTYGGDWGSMLLSGIRKLYPTVWDAIPDEMGVYAWTAICTVCTLLNVQA